MEQYSRTYESSDSLREAFVLVSVASPLFSKTWLKDFLHSISGRYNPTFILMDRPERYNIMVFDAVHEADALSFALTKTDRLTHELGLNTPTGFGAWRWQAIEALPQYPKYWTGIQDYFGNSGAFRRHCRSQVFSNLRPLVRAAGIRSKSDHRIAALIPYLLEEIAGKLCLTQEALFQAELLPRPEMDIMIAIHQGKYPPLTSLVRRKAIFRELTPELFVAEY